MQERDQSNWVATAVLRIFVKFEFFGRFSGAFLKFVSQFTKFSKKKVLLNMKSIQTKMCRFARKMSIHAIMMSSAESQNSCLSFIAFSSRLNVKQRQIPQKRTTENAAIALLAKRSRSYNQFDFLCY